MSQSPSPGSGSLLLAEEYFGAEDPRFLPAIRAVHAAQGPGRIRRSLETRRSPLRPHTNPGLSGRAAGQPRPQRGRQTLVQTCRRARRRRSHGRHARGAGRLGPPRPQDPPALRLAVARDLDGRRTRHPPRRAAAGNGRSWAQSANWRANFLPGPPAPQRPALHASHAGLPPPPGLALFPPARLPAPRSLRAGDRPGLAAIPRRRSRPGREHPRYLGPGTRLLSWARGLGVHVVADPAQRRPIDRREVLVNTDLKDFFPSITFPRVAGMFRGLGYSPAVATVLALLCTDYDAHRGQL